MATKYLSDDEVFGVSSTYLSDDEVFGRKAAPEKPERTWGQAAGDTGVQLAEGVNNLLGAVPNLVAPDSAAAEFFRSGSEYWREKQSDPLKQRIAAADQAISAAGEDGVIAQISEAAGQYFSDPALAARFVTTNLPSMIPGIGAAKLAQAASLARGASAVQAASAATTAAGATNAALNAGGARGEAFEDIKRTLVEQGLSAEEAEQQALSDSRVSAAVGALAGFVSGKTGLEGAIVGRAGGAGAVRAFTGGLVKEAAGEQIEEVSPKLTTNLLAGQYDGRDITQDVGRTMVETAIGAGPGSLLSGGLDAFSRQRQPDQLPPPPPPPPPTAGADLDAANAELEAAVDPYLGIKQATTVDEAIEAAGAAAAAPVPSPTLDPLTPTLDQRVAAAESRGLVQQQLDIQRQLDEASGLPTVPRAPGATPAQTLAQMQGAALPVGLPEQDIISRFEAKRAAAVEAIDQALGVAGAPRGESTPAELEAKRKRATQLALSEMGDTLPRFRYTPELQGNKQEQPGGPVEPDLVGAYVQQMRETNTPAARAFVQMFESGSITPTDVMSMLDRQSTKSRIAPEPEIPSNATPLPPADGIQVESASARAASPAMTEAVELYGNRPLTPQDLTVEGATARIERAGQRAPQPAAPGGIEVATELDPRGAFLGRNEAIRAGNNLPRPVRVGGVPAASLSDEQLQTTAANDALPAITRRGAQIELMARQQAQRGQEPTSTTPTAIEDATARLEAAAASAPVAPPPQTQQASRSGLPGTEVGGAPAMDAVAARLEAAAAQGRALAQPTAGRIITSTAKLSTPRAQVPGSQHTLQDQGVDHNYTVVEPGRLGGQGKLLGQVSRIFGKKLVVFESDTLQADGFVKDDDDSTVYINAKSSVSPLAVFGHELTHLIKRDNAAAYSALESVVKRNLAPEGMAEFEKEYGAGANLEELASDLTGNRFQEPKFWSDVFNEIAAANPEQSRSIITRLAGALNKAVGAFLKAVRQPGFKADQYVKDLEAVKAAVKSAVVQYAQQQREPAMRMEAELMRAESQVNLAAGSSAPANDSRAAIAASPARNAQVDTPEFKKFYEGSKVVDSKGRPVELYRGMRGESIPDDGADEFAPQSGLYGTGVYMSSGSRRADGYADGAKGQVYPVYAAVKNPIDSEDFIERFGRSRRSPAESQRITDQLVREGYDGVVERGGPGGFVEVVAFRGEQVKSAIGNDGSFDASSSKITRSPSRGVTASAQSENRMAVVVGAKPGEFDWNFTRSDLAPPPFAVPTQYGPRLEKIGESVYEILRSNGFKKLAEDAFGITGLRVAPLHGSWLNKPEPSFALYADGLTFEQADELSKMLGFAFAQDATVVFQPTSEESPGERPAVYIGGNKKLTSEQMKAVLSSAQAEGIDYSSTADGKAVRFLHFGDEAGLAELMQKTARIANSVGLGAPKVVFVRSQLSEAKDYTKGSGGSTGQAVWFAGGAAGRSDLFRRTVDHVLVPYAKAVGAEGYRFAVSRFGQRFGLSAEQQDLIRQALLPKSGADKSTVDIASGKVKLDIKPTGARGSVSVSDILWALQNRSAQAGLIAPGDYSDQARKLIAEAIADEVIYNVNDTSTGKSAIGWYDRALKAAKEKYAGIFPEIKSDRDRELLFDAVLGITSQGNDVFSNSLFAARVYELMTRQNKTLNQAVAALKGSFGGETVAIENNITKLGELLDRNGYDAMREFFNKKDSVSNINARLRSDTSLFYKNKPLAVDGAAEQRVTGWMVFGPKIGSFINNLHGDYSTLTADLWFSRTWNRILGFSFVHAPAREAEQYQTFMSALVAEYGFAKDREGPIRPKQITKSGEAKMPEFGKDAAELTNAELEQIIADPDTALGYATELEAAYRKGGYKIKSDLRRAAKNWIENRTDPVALPRTDLERDFQQRTVETAQKIIKRRTGTEITIADIQAALWYYEKDNLFKLLGGTNKKSEAADYAGAAEETVRAYRAGDLFYAKTDDRYVFGSKGSYLQGGQLSRTRERKAADIPVAELRGRKVAMQVRIEDTGETGTLTMDAADSLTDIDERESAMQRLLECLRK